MQQIAKFITRHLEAKGIDALIYLDDIVGISAPFDKAIADFNYTVDLLAYLGLPLAVGKAVPPTRDIVWLGIRFSIQEKFLQIPPQKLHEIVTDIDTLSKRSRMNRRDVQRLAGRINHVAKVCRPARLFMSRILMYLRGHPPGYTKVSEGTKADLRWLNRFLPEYNGVSILQKEQPIRSIEADSCMIGVNGNTYLDIAMPFGARMSSLYMQQIAKFITRHLEAKGIDALIYLDDIVGISAPFDKAIADFNYTVDLLAYLGLPLAVGKAVPPTRDIVWLGIRFSIQEKFLQIPPQKLHEIVTDIDTLSKRSRMNRRDVQRLAGRINHVAKVCRPARLFMSRILMYLRGHPPGYTKVSEGTKADLRWLNRFLPEYNGVSILQKEQPIRSIEADSCMIGGGAASGDKCYMYKYIPPLLGEMHISQLEAVNCVAAIRAFISSADRGNTVEVKCDNMAAVSTYTSGHGRDEILLACARAIWWHMAATDTTIVFTHTPGILMGTADTLSRAFLSDTHHARAQAMIAERGFTVVHLSDERFMSLIFCDSDPSYDYLLEMAAHRQTTAHRPGTVGAHRRALSTFVAFSAHFNIDYTCPGVNHILAYIEYLAQHFKSPQSVKNSISSLSTAMKRAGRPLQVLSHFKVQLATRAIEINMRHVPTRKRPVTPQELDDITKSVWYNTRNISAVCAIAMAFTGFLRQSNLVAKSAQRSIRLVQ